MVDDEIKLSFRIDDNFDREIANISGVVKKEIISIQHFPMTKKNTKHLNGKWKIFNYIDEYDNDEKLDIDVQLKLVGNGQVMVAGEKDQIFRISLIKKTTIALIRKLNDGYEILEAEKIIEDKIETSLNLSTSDISNEKAKNPNERAVILKDAEIVLDKVLIPSKSKKILIGDLAEGEASIVDNVLQNLEIRLTFSKQDILELDIPFAEITDGGYFSCEIDEKTSQGIITNDGTDGYRIRFATGPISGSIFNFITKERWDKNKEKEYSRDNLNEEEIPDGNQARNRRMIIQDKVSVDAKFEQEDAVQARESEVMEMEEEDFIKEDLTPEEVAATLKKNGFNFGQKTRARFPAKI